MTMQRNCGEYRPPEDLPEKTETEAQPDESAVTVETGSVRPQDARHLIHCLTVIGQVEGHFELPSENKTTKYEHIIPALVAIEQDRSIEGLLIILNTVGGDVEAGLAIAELIAGMKTPTVSLVVGGGPSAAMTIHPVRMNGTVLGVPQSLTYIDRIQERIIQFVTRRSRITAEDFRRLMTNTEELATDVGSVLSGQQAVDLGLIDRIGTLSDAIEGLYELIEALPLRYPEPKKGNNIG